MRAVVKQICIYHFIVQCIFHLKYYIDSILQEFILMSTSAYSSPLNMDMPPPSLPPFLLKAIPKDHAQKRRASRAAKVCVDNADDATVKRVKHEIEAECLKATRKAREMTATPKQIADYQNGIKYTHKIEEREGFLNPKQIVDFQNFIEYIQEIEEREMYATPKHIADYQNDIKYIHMCQDIDIENP